MPLLHEISSDESDGEGDTDNLPYPASSGDDTNAPGSAPEGPADSSLYEEDSSAPDPAVPSEESQEGGPFQSDVPTDVPTDILI